MVRVTLPHADIVQLCKLEGTLLDASFTPGINQFWKEFPEYCKLTCNLGILLTKCQNVSECQYILKNIQLCLVIH